MRALALLAALVAVASCAVLPSVALATNDNAQNAVGGASSKWYSGTLLQQSGEDCSVLGAPFSETMVSAIAGYGGVSNGGVVHVGDRYYANVLISIPGNPCGPGSAFVGTDLVLPRGTSVDSSAPIRCFGIPRGQSAFSELTGGGWSFPFQNGTTATGQYCPATVGLSLTGTSGAVGVGFRPLASGQLYELFVPIKSTQQLLGAATSPPDQVTWVLSTSGTYNNTGSTSAWVNVFPNGSGNTASFYATRDPAAQTYWVQTPTDGFPQSRVAFYVSFFSAGRTGTLCYGMYEPDFTDLAPFTCTNPAMAGWPVAVTSAFDTWPITGVGPDGGFAFGFLPPPTVPANQMWTMRFTFTPNDGGPAVAPKDIVFHSVTGPDADGDGVPDATDACPAVKGTQSNGCQPPVQTDPDGDGVFGAADKCPGQNGSGSIDGCPAVVPPVTVPTTPTTPTTTTTVPLTIPTPPLKAPTLRTSKASATLKGSTITINTGLSIGCPAGGPSCPVSLTGTISGAQAAKAKKKKPKPLTVGSARLTVAAGKTVAITFKLSSKAKSLLAKHHRLTIALAGSATTGPGGPKTQIKKSISVSNPPKRKSKHH